MSALKAVIYDCDGVLINSRRSNEAFYNQILARFERPPLTPAQLDQVHVSTSQAAVDYLFQGDPRREEAQAYQRQINNDPFLALITLEPSIREVLETLRPAYRTAIATNRGRSLPRLLRRLGIAALFDFTVSCFDVTHPKPHPQCLHMILEHFHLTPAEALYIGDAAVDQEVAAAAGMTFVAYKNRRLQTPYHLQDHLELLQILREMPG